MAELKFTVESLKRSRVAQEAFIGRAALAGPLLPC